MCTYQLPRLTCNVTSHLFIHATTWHSYNKSPCHSDIPAGAYFLSNSVPSKQQEMYLPLHALHGYCYPPTPNEQHLCQHHWMHPTTTTQHRHTKGSVRLSYPQTHIIRCTDICRSSFHIYIKPATTLLFELLLKLFVMLAVSQH